MFDSKPVMVRVAGHRPTPPHAGNGTIGVPPIRGGAGVGGRGSPGEWTRARSSGMGSLQGGGGTSVL